MQTEELKDMVIKLEQWYPYANPMSKNVAINKWLDCMNSKDFNFYWLLSYKQKGVRAEEFCVLN